MSTLNQIGSKIMNYLRGGFQIDDNKLDWELVYDEIHKQRAVAIEEDFKANKQLDSSLYQEVCCLEIECTPIICDGIDSGDSENRVQLPELLVVQGKSYIKYFGGVDKRSPYSELGIIQNVYKADMLYGKKKTSYTRIGTAALLYDLPTCATKYTCLIAILANPVLTGCTRLTESDEYPLPKRLEARVEYLCIMSLAGMMGVNPEQLNNARDDIRESFGYNRKKSNSPVG